MSNMNPQSTQQSTQQQANQPTAHYNCAQHQYSGTIVCPACNAMQCAPRMQNTGGMTAGRFSTSYSNPQTTPKPQGITSSIAQAIQAQFDVPSFIGEEETMEWLESSRGARMKVNCVVINFDLSSDRVTLKTCEDAVYPDGFKVEKGYIAHISMRDFYDQTFKWQTHKAPAAAIVDHSGHNVVENMALNKKFHYCRDCKVEVIK